MFYFGFATFNYFVEDEDTPGNLRIWASLSPTIAMIQTSYVIGKFESSQVGSNFDNIWAEYNNYSVGIGFVMMSLNCVWVVLLGLYFEQVTPKTYGRREHPCFCFMSSFWGCNSKKKAKIGVVGVETGGEN